ncbi:hypothetical protein A3762_14935 [Oleiphilus sp. HI0125]|nr:hypothetical protein A3762_14935 [Oleiphilus sp. HI0125]
MQLTVGQFYNPDFLRGYGVGVLNGSLWTIPIELQFYALLPLIYLALRRLSFSAQNITLACLIFVMVLMNQININLIAPQDTIYSKLFGVTVLPYLYMFLLGVLIQKNFRRVQPLFSGRFWNWLGLFVVWLAICFVANLPFQGNSLNPISSTLLGCLTISAAFSQTNLSHWLQGNDISYGIYIYHMIIVNLFIETSPFQNNKVALITMLIATMATALASWKLVEKPCLKLKQSSIHKPT